MSFDVYLVPFKDGAQSLGDAVAARAVLERHRYRHEPQHDFYDVQFDDGSHVNMFAGGLDLASPFESCSFNLRGMSESILQFMFDFARAGGCVIMPAMDPPYAMFPSPGMEQHLPEDIRSGFVPVQLESADHLGSLLVGGQDEWLKYRDQVLNPGGRRAEHNRRL